MFANGPRFHWKLAKLAGLNISGRVYYVSVSVIAGYCYQGTTGINSIEKLLKTLMPVSSPRERSCSKIYFYSLQAFTMEITATVCEYHSIRGISVLILSLTFSPRPKFWGKVNSYVQ